MHQQCTRRCECSSGSSEDDFALEHIVVVAYSVYYRRARADFENLPSLHEMWTPVVSEILFTEVNCNVLRYEGREINTAEEVVTLEEKHWFYGAKNSSVEDMRLELIRYRGNNCFIAGWNLGLLFTALGMAIPEWTVIDLATDPYLREYCNDAAVKRGLPGELFNENIWYTIDRRLLAVLANPPDSGPPIELWRKRNETKRQKRDVTREALFTAAMVRHFIRPFTRRYRERYNDNVYRQMVCGAVTRVKALATRDQ